VTVGVATAAAIAVDATVAETVGAAEVGTAVEAAVLGESVLPGGRTAN
jgi:hypothetical protein